MQEPALGPAAAQRFLQRKVVNPRILFQPKDFLEMLDKADALEYNILKIVPNWSSWKGRC